MAVNRFQQNIAGPRFKAISRQEALQVPMELRAQHDAMINATEENFKVAASAEVGDRKSVV